MRHRKCVIRIEQAYCSGWQARCTVRGKHHTKFFNDRKHDGTRRAHAACLAYVMAWHKRHRKPYVQGSNVITKRRNKSGVVGVYFGRNGTPYARVTIRGQQITAYMLPGDTVQDAANMRRILEHGFSTRVMYANQ